MPMNTRSKSSQLKATSTSENNVTMDTLPTSENNVTMATPPSGESTSAINMDVSISNRSTLTRRSPPSSVYGRRQPVLHPKDTAGEESTLEEVTRTTPSTCTIETPIPTSQEESHPSPQIQERSVAMKSHLNEGNTPTSREESLQQPRPKKTTRDLDTHSVRSSHRKRAEAQARMTIALRELELAEARSKVAQAELELLATESEEEDGAGEELYEQTQEVEQWFIQSKNKSKDLKPIETEEKKSDIQELASVILKLSEKSRDNVSSKHFELPHFNGSCEEWLAFKRSYEDMAASFTNNQNLARLRIAIQGKAREAVQSLLFTAEDPREVIKGLEARFGRPGALALAELEKMKNLSKVGENPSDICVFASKVKNAVQTIKALKKPHYLSSPETLRVIVDKMPTSMKFRWFAYHRSRRDEEIQELLLVEAFLELEADMCGDFAPPEVSLEQKKAIRRPIHTVQEASQQKYKKSCPFCEEEHFAFECEKFKEADINEKWDMIKKAKICFKCLRFKHSRINCKAPVCKQCKRWHHTMLHSDKPPVRLEKEVNQGNMRSTSEEKVASILNSKGEEKAYLKIIPVDLYGPKGQVRVLALLDEGSTVTLLDAAVAEKIGVEGKQEELTIETIGGKILRKDSSKKIEFKIKGAHRREKRTIIARTIDDLKLSEQCINEDTVKNCQHLRAIESQLLYVTERPKLLIGQDNWGLIITRRLKKGKPSEPVASLTNLGWVLHGFEAGTTASVNFIHYNRSTTDEECVEEIVRTHFQLESLGIENRSPTNDSDRRALETLEKTTKKLSSGQYESGLLWKKEDETLPNNYSQAMRRLVSIEKKLDKDHEAKEHYEKQIQSLLEKGYAEKAPATSSKGRTFYLPHFAVVHPIKKKLRIVFDAAAKFEGKSLNDALLSGPDLLQSLFGVLLRFRQGPVAVMADIQDMFLRVKVREDDRDSLRFLWRGSRRTGKPEEYRMSSIIFGAASSPATAIYVMNKNAEEFKKTHPEAVKAINRNHYMDDYLQSFASTAEAKKISKEVRDFHARANFHLKGWASNNLAVLSEVEDTNEEDSLQLTKEEKTLGLRWLVKEDTLAFNVGLRNTSKELQDGRRTSTKREVTSAVMSTFDPMGFATPVLIQGKKLIQDIWRTKIDWDEEINEQQKETWLNYLEEVSKLARLNIPRCISPRSRRGQLHTFTDASEEAYSAVVYWRTVEPGGKVHISMIAGKARVTPTKPVSIPRLELQAALLGSRLATTIEEESELEISKKVYWTDSSTVLQWIKSEPRKFKTFVANRLAEIEEKSKPDDWRWVPTKENPADDATRGTPIEFDHNARWFKGPSFLRQPEEEWPFHDFKSEGTMPEEKNKQKVMAIKTAEDILLDPERFSSWERLLRTTARVVAFTSHLLKAREATTTATCQKDESWKPERKTQKKIKQNSNQSANKNDNKRQYLPLDEEHLKKAKNFLLKMSQNDSFASDVNNLKKEKPLESASRLKKIDVYIGDDGIIKLRSRTMKFHDNNGRKMNPIILDGKQKITRLIIQHYHKKFLHGNTATVMNEIRQKYWILGLRTTLKAVAHNCQWCKTKKSLPEIPPTGDLPSERLQHHQFPFSCAAVDYFGPMQVTIGRRIEKRWGALFTCLTTRAVHLELVPSLSTSSMIMALRRMAARRGTPRTIFSDNGTNFVGAKKELEEAAQEKGIKWKFIPPGTPNMGGAWERLVRTVKTALAVVLNERSPPEEVLHTLMTEVEHIVNSRPLTSVSMDPEDEESLTPNHFLLGRSCGATAPGEFDDTELIGKANWRTTQRLADHFWNRWVKEYLPLLMPRKLEGKETKDPKEGDIVLIVDGTLPRNSWPRGEVVKTYPGPDGRTRVLDVRTSGGILRRPTRRIIVLVPAASSPPEDEVLRTVGENISDDK
ncbi:hypothetical protein PYW07_007734 [Mythimna separata]|uniref:Integrase catalytic domain-containing protein n=1 Tax=Mythimna separata TaxID=271217 RepID=A0AAD8DU67_MYTSE|nr:hypothetical protein PYW07_007734 [Mythimna separata]